jgi:proline dehydrogenase
MFHLRFSGAGPSVLDALSKRLSPPTLMWDAMLEICDTAVKQKSRIWIDAEQQNIQPAIESWTIDLMRQYNRSKNPMMYTTIQTYLKQAPENVLRHLKLAQAEDWALGIKLVRGAYIGTEERSLIHDTIEDTHRAYNSIVEHLLKQNFPGLNAEKPYPRTALFLATHNDESIKRAYSIQKSLTLAQTSTIELGYGQLQGMADEVSCGLLQLCQTVQPGEANASNLVLAPNAFKCLSWGTTQECLQFLLRRVKENKDALGRTKFWVASFRAEIWRRMRSTMGFI